MKTNSGLQKTNFGWNATTHKNISRNAVNQVNKKLGLKKGTYLLNSAAISESSILPDKEPHLKGSHCADIKNLVTGDCYDLFVKTDEKIILAINNKNTEFLNANIGRALHYIQDMLNPLHVKSKKTDYHLLFEESANQQEKSIIDEAKKRFDVNTEFNSFLKDKMLETTELCQEINQKNTIKKKETQKYQKLSITNAYNASIVYLYKIGKLLEGDL